MTIYFCGGGGSTRGVRAAVVCLAAGAIALGACGGKKQRRNEGVVTIDPSIAPKVTLAPGPDGAPRAAGAVVGADGRATVFVVNEVLVEPSSRQELEQALALTQGVVVSDDRPPAPPAGSGIQFDPNAYPATSYVIRVDPAKLAASTLIEDARALGHEGEIKVSSEDSAKLIALIAKGARAKVPIGMNFLMEGSEQTMLLSTQEHAPASAPGTFADGFAQTAGFSARSPEKSGVREAWQLAAAHGARRVRIAILDGGFWLQPNGDAPIVNGGSDLPAHPLQYDFQGNDYIADGQNPASCTGGTPCPWHGNGAAGAAAGIINNRYGGAGAAGFYADPLLFKIELSNGNVKRAVRTAKAWNADVISMSFGGQCGFWCKIGRSIDGYYRAIVEARDAGIFVVAAAGNDNRDVAMDTEPCVWAHLCVGMLATGTNTRDPRSNFGLAVRLFAPHGIVVHPDPNSGGQPVVFTGTSAATPVVAGVGATMKAIDPSLTGAQIDKLLHETAWTDSSDPNVTRYLDALAAVRAAAGQKLPQDGHEPNNTPAAARPIAGGAIFERRTIHATDDLDAYKLTLNDYTLVDAKLTHTQGIGLLSYSMRPIGALGEPEGARRTSRPNVLEYHADVLPPGEWLIELSARTATMYRIELTTSGNALQPDRFEQNETAQTAAAPGLGLGEHRATIHRTSDVDWYEVDIPAKPPDTEGFSFIVHETDRTIVVQIYDAAGALVRTRTVPGGTAASIQIPEGRHRVKVTAAETTRYVFSCTTIIDRSRLKFVNKELREIPTGWPGVYARILLRGEGLLGVSIDSTIRRIEVRGPVRAVLLDTDGKELRRGTPLTTKTPALGERIEIAGVEPGMYALRITRAGADHHGDDSVETDGAVPYELAIEAAGPDR